MVIVIMIMMMILIIIIIVIIVLLLIIIMIDVLVTAYGHLSYQDPANQYPLSLNSETLH